MGRTIHWPHRHYTRSNMAKREMFFSLTFSFAVSIAFTIAATAVKGGDNLAASMATFAKEMAEENMKLHQKVEKLRQQDDKHRDDNESLRKEFAELRRETSQLRQANSEIAKSSYQKDHNDTQELKKLIRSEINGFLKDEKTCVSGSFLKKGYYNAGTETVQYGLTFPRKPAVSVSISTFYLAESNQLECAVFSVGDSSAVIGFYQYSKSGWAWFSWIACL